MSSDFIMLLLSSIILLSFVSLYLRYHRKKKQEIKLLNKEFEGILARNPKKIKDYVTSYLTIFGNDYVGHLSHFQRCVLLHCRKDTKAYKLLKRAPDIEKEINDEIEDEIAKYFEKTIVSSDETDSKRIISNFVSTYGNDYGEDEFYKLKYLLESKGTIFHADKILEKVIYAVFYRHEYEKLKQKLLNYKFSDRDAYTRVYLELYGNFDWDLDRLYENEEIEEESLDLYTPNEVSYLRLFNKFLEELGYEEISRLELKDFRRTIELERFERRIENTNKEYTIKKVDILDGDEFETFIKKLFEKMGYNVRQTSLSNDQGADLIATKFGEKISIQVKRYSGNVSNTSVQEVVASKNYYNSDKCMVVTNSYFTNSAVELARVNSVELINRDKLLQLIDRYM